MVLPSDLLLSLVCDGLQEDLLQIAALAAQVQQRYPQAAQKRKQPPLRLAFSGSED